MHFSIVAKILGMLLMVFSLTMLPPIVVGLIYGESTHQAFLTSFSITFMLGILLWLPFNQSKVQMQPRDGFLVTLLFWLELVLVGALPFSLTDALHLSIADAIFESTSGLTTTGATVISGLDSLPKSLLYYRQQLQWLGGIGIVVIAVAIMPMLGIGGMQLYRAELPGHVKDSKLKPRLTETAKILFNIYIVLTLLCLVAYWIAGMSFFDALCHSFSTIAIGGFSTHDSSMGFFADNDAIIAICIFFMSVSGINFGLHYYGWVKESLGHYWKDIEAKTYLITLFVGSVITCGYLYFSDIYNGENSVLHGTFQLVSVMTTTGFTTINFSEWPTFLPCFLIILSFFGACAGSTGGGIKVGRMLILAKQSLREIYRMIYPSAVMPVKMGHHTVPERVTGAIWAFFGVYLAVFYIIMLLLLASGLDFITAWSATAASLNNLGPGLGDVALSYGDVNAFAKIILSGGMLLGRLEIFTLLVLFTPMFWRR